MNLNVMESISSVWKEEPGWQDFFRLVLLLILSILLSVTAYLYCIFNKIVLADVPGWYIGRFILNKDTRWNIYEF